MREVLSASAAYQRTGADSSGRDADAEVFSASPLYPGEGRGPVGMTVVRYRERAPNWTPAFAGVRSGPSSFSDVSHRAGTQVEMVLSAADKYLLRGPTDATPFGTSASPDDPADGGAASAATNRSVASEVDRDALQLPVAIAYRVQTQRIVAVAFRCDGFGRGDRRRLRQVRRWLHMRGAGAHRYFSRFDQPFNWRTNDRNQVTNVNYRIAGGR